MRVREGGVRVVCVSERGQGYTLTHPPCTHMRWCAMIVWDMYGCVWVCGGHMRYVWVCGDHVGCMGL